jgi:hypothetical protein
MQLPAILSARIADHLAEKRHSPAKFVRRFAEKAGSRRKPL